MSEPYLGEIRMVAFGYAPQGWALCQGQTLPINQNQALFALLGTRYGGNGVTTFALPDLRGRVPIHMSAAIPQGSSGGEAAHTLTAAEMPAHTHLALAGTESSSATTTTWGTNTAKLYASSADSTMNASAIRTAGSSQAHNNMQPYTVLNFAIALSGIFPSQN